MRISTVVAHLREYCPTVSQRVAAALDFEPGDGKVAFAAPALVVLPDGDDAAPSQAQNVTVQAVEDRFTVVLRLTTVDPKRGDVTVDQLHDLRAEVWRALIGWRPGAGYEPIEYVGGEVLAMDRAFTHYGLIFRAELTVGWAAGLPEGATPETWQEYELAGLPALAGIDMAVDVIDPIANPRPGPDARDEFELHEDLI